MATLKPKLSPEKAKAAKAAIREASTKMAERGKAATKAERAKKKPSRTKRVIEKATEELGKRSKAATPAKGRTKPTIVSSEGKGVRTPLKRI